MADGLIRELHSARLNGDLETLCKLFHPNGRFKISGASAGKPVVIDAVGLVAFRPWLSMLVKVFRLTHYELTSTVVESPRAVVHWKADIVSRVTGITVPTELVDLVEIGERQIVAYTEFFVSR